MSNHNYSRICTHPRLDRINSDFVRCLNCGQSMISQQKMSRNKTRQDFTKENKSFDRNFDRNFTNIIEETDMNHEGSQELFDYYTDRNWANTVVINRTVQFQSNPPKYEVEINGKNTYLTADKIQELLDNIRAVRIDEGQYKMRQNKN